MSYHLRFNFTTDNTKHILNQIINREEQNVDNIDNKQSRTSKLDKNLEETQAKAHIELDSHWRN
jgi:hypothetical protein